METTTEILCSRCGTQFPQDKGTTSVTCAVCGQLRPDLDMTLEDDDDEGLADGLGTGAGGRPTIAHSAISDYEAPPKVLTSPVQSLPDTQPFRVDRPYVAMSEQGAAPPAPKGESLFSLIGPVLLVIPALAAGMAGALHMLYVAPDFSRGSWYAVAVAAACAWVATFASGTFASGFLFMARVRSLVLLRLAFFLAAVSVGYLAYLIVPMHLLVRPDAFPGILLRN